MQTQYKIPAFGKYSDQLAAAGIRTSSARGFWGGVTSTGDIVVTSWIDDRADTRYFIHRPKTDHGGLKTAWQMSHIAEGTEVKLILLRPRGGSKPGDPVRHIKDAALMNEKYKVVEVWDHSLALIDIIK